MTKIREGYKETEIGVIPMDWEVAKVNDIATFVGSGITPKGGQNVYTSAGVPFIRSQNVHPNALKLDDVVYITDEINSKMRRTILKEKDVLLNITGASIGRCAIVPVGFGKGNVNQHVCIIRVDDTYSPFFLSQFLNSKLSRKQIDSFNGGSSREGLNFQQVRSILLSKPPLQEQQRIAEILATTDDHIEKLDKTIEDYQLLKKGMIKKFLTEGIGYTEFKDTEVGRIPKEWEVKELSEISEIVTGSTPKTSDKENYGNEYIWASPADLGKTKYINVTTKMLSEEGFSKSRQLPIGTILVTCIGSTIGKLGILSDIGSTNQQINSMICNENAYNEYVYYALDFYFVKYTSYISTQAVPIINKTVFSKLKLPIPPLQEQQQIASILSELDNKINLYQKQREDYTQLKKALMEQLLTGKIRVNQ